MGSPRSWLCGVSCLLLAGCGQAEGRRFAVTLLEAEEIRCSVEQNDFEIDLETLERIADDFEEQWAAATEFNPPRRVGRQLNLTAIDERAQLWFEPSTYTYEPTGELRLVDDPSSVYLGEVADGLIEAYVVLSINTDELDDDDGRDLCGDRVLKRGVMILTDDSASGIKGRVQWTNSLFISSSRSACGGVVSCTRDLLIEGAELER